MPGLMSSGGGNEKGYKNIFYLWGAAETWSMLYLDSDGKFNSTNGSVKTEYLNITIVALNTYTVYALKPCKYVVGMNTSKENAKQAKTGDLLFRGTFNTSNTRFFVGVF